MNGDEISGPEKSEPLVPRRLTRGSTNDDIARRIFEADPGKAASFKSDKAMSDSQAIRLFADTAVTEAHEKISEIVNGDRGSSPLYTGHPKKYPQE